MITVIGHGYIGTEVIKKLIEKEIKFTWTSHSNYVPIHTDVIINAAGYTGSPNVDACESNKEKTINGNVLWPLKLERAHPNIPIVHISSGCVYTGYTKDYTEEDEPNFDFDNGSFYSGSKALAQRLLMPYMNKSYLLRIRMPFGDKEDNKNLLTKYIRYSKLIDFKNSVSYIDDVANVAIHFATERPQFGIYNVCNPGAVTTKQVADMMGLKKEWFTEEAFMAAVKAPRSNCVLNVDKLMKVFPIQDSLSALHKAILKYS